MTILIWSSVLFLLAGAALYALSQHQLRGPEPKGSAAEETPEISDVAVNKPSSKPKKKVTKSASQKGKAPIKNQNSKKKSQSNQNYKNQNKKNQNDKKDQKHQKQQNKPSTKSKGISAALLAHTKKRPEEKKHVDLSSHHHHFRSHPNRETRRVALQFGLLYKGTEFELKGCVNDVNNIYERFLKHHGFTEDHTILFTDDSKFPPTKSNMCAAFKQFVEKSIDGDILFIQYSGHGTEVEDHDGDEDDGFDEALCPLDGGTIIDDWLFEHVVKPLDDKPKAHLFVMVDACHSGTCLDLQHRYIAIRGDKPSVLAQTDKNPNRAAKGHVVSFAAALDNQTATDVQDGVPQGAFTEMFLEVARKHRTKKMSYREFLLDLDSQLAKGGYDHQASLNSSRVIDLDKEATFW